MEANKRTSVKYEWRWRKNVLLENCQEIPYYLSNRDFEDTLGNYRRDSVRENLIRDIEYRYRSKVVGHAVTFWIERTVMYEYDDEAETRIIKTEKLHKAVHHYEGRYVFSDEELKKHCEETGKELLEELKAEDKARRETENG